MRVRGQPPGCSRPTTMLGEMPCVAAIVRTAAGDEMFLCWRKVVQTALGMRCSMAKAPASCSGSSW